MRKILLLFTVLFTMLLVKANAQTRQITGSVTEEGTKEPLLGASISIKGTTQGTQVGADGKYKLNIPATGSVVLVVRFIGYNSQEIAVTKQTTVNVVLKPSSVELNEVVAVGFATVRRRDLTGSVSSVTAKQLQDIPVSSAAEALAGRLAGVQVTKSEGSPDADIKIRVRGGGSITQDNSPLYIIDGVQVENGLAGLSPQDIESIDVLKDAASTSIYGARGANGVVIITTKGGHEQKTSVAYNGFAGVSTLAKELPVLSPYDFVVYQWERNRFASDSTTNFIPDYGSTWAGLDAYKNTPAVDWQKRALGLHAAQQSHNISITGGTKATQFNISYTNTEQNGTVINSDYGRNLLNFRFDHTASDHFKVGVNVRYNDQIVHGAGTSNSGSSTYNGLRNSVKYRPFDIPGQSADTYDPNYLAETLAAGNNVGVLNPIVNSNAQYRASATTILDLNGYVNYIFNKYVQFKSTLGLDYNTQKQNAFDDVVTFNAKLNGGGLPILTLASLNNNTANLSNVLSFSNAAADPKHSDFSILLGNEFYNQNANGLSSTYKTFPNGVTSTDAINQPNLGVLAVSNPVPTNYTNHLVSFFTRVNYAFDKKYLAQFTIRADGSSKFADGNRWGYFPSGSFAWKLSDEKFMQNFKALSSIKVRLSYGTSGNNRINDYLYQTAFYANTLYSLNENTGNLGFSSTSLANLNLKWETTVSKNIGLDFGILNDRIQVSLDAYRNNTKDLLLNASIPTSSGYTTQFQNIGQTQNQGLEVQLNATVLHSKAFNWTANFNIAYNENKIIALASGQNSFLQSSGYGVSGTPSDFIVQVGQPVGMVYGYVSDGFYTTNDFDYDPSSKKYTLKAGPNYVDASKIIGTPFPGMTKFKITSANPTYNANGNPVLSTADQTTLGNTVPKFTGGLNQQFTYKGFDLSFFVNFQAGGKVFNANAIEFTNGYTSNTNLLASAAGRWRTIDGNGVQVENTGTATGASPDVLNAINANATQPVPITGPAQYYAASKFVESSSFIRLNNLTVGYTFKNDLLKKIKVSKLRIYATGNNIAIITGYSGYDPDVNTRRATSLTPGVDYAAYPRSRTFLLGVNLSL
ncbi:TonB-linked SusC/RagA family outer membrane protein [Mucilaginibacter gracilis]|uniref:TonB-linked SusC/RagA family outer membrane protein n=1 Tax=Mucilaginibacter gracilis TaxID=423350 RepID=A0A495J063_9SPHI|nr:TonB-dependent receptor [Mucilaginibacter gracilis]RKR81479.1 TonB-linked SusC/RagA family outer membrane protein [Mucilaginibacter gracilis]